MTRLLETSASGVRLPPLGDVATLEQQFRQILRNQPDNADAYFVLKWSPSATIGSR